MSTDIGCKKCNTLLGKTIDGEIEVRNSRGVMGRGGALRIYGIGLVCLDCPRCGRTTEVEIVKS